MIWEIVKFVVDVLLVIVGTGVIVGCACVCALVSKALEDESPSDAE